MHNSSVRSPLYNAGLEQRTSRMPLQRGVGGEEEELEMEEVDLQSLRPWAPTLALHEGQGEAQGRAWATVVASCFRAMSSWSLLQLRRIRQSLSFRGTSSPPRGLCPSSLDLQRAISGSDGCVHTLRGAPRVERLQTELFLMESLSTTQRRSPPETWSPRLPLATTIQFGNRLGLLRLSSPRTCSCPGNGTP